MDLEIDADGDVYGEGSCSISGQIEAELAFDGAVDADGEMEGVLVLSQSWVGSFDLDVEGSAAGESEIDTEVEGMLELYGYEVFLFGDMTLERMESMWVGR